MIKFGTGGFRGVIGDDFNRKNVCIIAEALSRIIRDDKSGLPVVIGYDNRFMSDFFARWMTEVFAAHKISCLLYTHQAPSPAVMCATRDLGLDYGIIITASHNPFQFSGVKLFLKGGVDADVNFTARMEQYIEPIETFDETVEKIPFEQAKNSGLVKDFSNIEEYVEHIKEYIDPRIKNNDIRILFDNICGVGYIALEKLAKEFNIAEFDILHKNHDAFFAFELPNPTNEVLFTIREKVLEGGYDYAMATDSDGDRLGILDEKGNYVDNNDILASLYYYLVHYKGLRGDVVKNCATSVLLDKLADKFGYKCYEVDVGFKNISAKMKETDALIGGESSGGLTCRGYLYGKDSSFSASLFMEMRIIMNKPVSEIIKETRAFAGYTYCSLEDQVDLTKKSKSRQEIMLDEPVFGRKIVNKQVYGNNVKYIFENDCWALMRFSGTEPILRIFAEAETREECQRIMQISKDFVCLGAAGGNNERERKTAV